MSELNRAGLEYEAVYDYADEVGLFSVGTLTSYIAWRYMHTLNRPKNAIEAVKHTIEAVQHEPIFDGTSLERIRNDERLHFHLAQYADALSKATGGPEV